MHTRAGKIKTNWQTEWLDDKYTNKCTLQTYICVYVYTKTRDPHTNMHKRGDIKTALHVKWKYWQWYICMYVHLYLYTNNRATIIAASYCCSYNAHSYTWLYTCVFMCIYLGTIVTVEIFIFTLHKIYFVIIIFYLLCVLLLLKVLCMLPFICRLVVAIADKKFHIIFIIYLYICTYYTRKRKLTLKKNKCKKNHERNTGQRNRKEE